MAAQQTVTADLGGATSDAGAADAVLVLALEGDRPMAAPVAIPLRGVATIEIGRGDALQIQSGTAVAIKVADSRVSTCTGRPSPAFCAEPQVSDSHCSRRHRAAIPRGMRCC